MIKFERLQSLVLQIKLHIPITIKRELKINKYSFVHKILKEINISNEVKKRIKIKYSLIDKIP